MLSFHEELRTLTLKATELHKKERSLIIESVIIVGKLEALRAPAYLGMSSEKFARRIGLSPGTYWRRAQVARLFAFHPEALGMLERGETDVSCLAVIAPKITEANRDRLLEGIKGQTKRDVIALASRITPDGELLDQEAEVECKIILTESELAIIDRAREVLSHNGHRPRLKDILLKAVVDLLERRDPMRQAERWQAKQRKSKIIPSDSEADLQKNSAKVYSPAEDDDVTKDRKSGSTMSGWKSDTSMVSDFVTDAAPPVKEQIREAFDPKPTPVKRGIRDLVMASTVDRRKSIPRPVRHALWVRDQGRCVHMFGDGTICGSRTALEIDHLTPFARGGSDDLSNLRLACRHHNEYAAT